MMNKLMAYVIMATAVCGIAKTTSGAANCANANGDKYTLTLTGGTTVSEGKSLTFTITPSPSSVTLDNPTWSVNPVGSPTKILKNCTITPATDGKSANIVFYWFPGGTCQYKVKFNSGGIGDSSVCNKEQNVTVTLPSIGGHISASYFSPTFGYTIVDPYDPNSDIVLNSVTLSGVTFTLAPNTIPTNSPFSNKVTKHEAQHVADFTGGTSSPVAVQANLWIQSRCQPDFGTTMTKTAYLKYSGDIAVAVNAYAEWWAEKEAYTVSNAIAPHDAYEQNL